MCDCSAGLASTGPVKSPQWVIGAEVAVVQQEPRVELEPQRLAPGDDIGVPPAQVDITTAMPYSRSMEMELDPEKDKANIEKHGISLAFGGKVLRDPHRLDVLDVRVDYGENRFICYGKVAGRVWVCVFTEREDSYRPISVRKANERETRRYDETPRRP